MMDYSALDVPGPTITKLSQPFWDAVSEGQLLIQFCTSCSKGVFYPRPICPLCWADALEWHTASGKGKLTSFTKIWKPGHPGWLTVAPYLVGLVQLHEGPTMLSHILQEGQIPNVGDPVIFKPTRIGKLTLPFFATVPTGEI